MYKSKKTNHDNFNKAFDSCFVKETFYHELIMELLIGIITYFICKQKQNQVLKTRNVHTRIYIIL